MTRSNFESGLGNCFDPLPVNTWHLNSVTLLVGTCHFKRYNSGCQWCCMDTQRTENVILNDGYLEIDLIFQIT